MYDRASDRGAAMTKAASKPPPQEIADEIDPCCWPEEQAQLLHAWCFDEFDLVNLMEEVSGTGGSARQKIEGRLVILPGQPLTWTYQRLCRTGELGWDDLRASHRDHAGHQRETRLKERYPALVLHEYYVAGWFCVAEETGIDLTLLPEQPPFSLEQVLDIDYMQTEPSSLAR